MPEMFLHCHEYLLSDNDKFCQGRPVRMMSVARINSVALVKYGYVSAFRDSLLVLDHLEWN